MKQLYSKDCQTRRARLTVTLLLVTVAVVPPPAYAIRNLKIGDPLPAFYLPRVDGTASLFESKQLLGQPSVIVFWRPNHTLSLDALLDLEAVAQKIGPSRFKLLAVDAKLSTPQDVQAALAGQNITFPVVLDPQRILYEEVGLIVCPTTLLFDAKGTLQFVVASHTRQFRQVVQARLRFLLGEIDEQTMNEQIKPAIRSIEPDLAAAWRMYNLGLQLQAEGKVEEAASIFEKTIVEHPSLAEAYCALGFLRFSAADPNKAAELFQAALQHNPSLPQARLGQAMILARTGKEQDAEQILLTLLGQTSIAARTRYELGRVYAASGQTQKALTFYQEALALVFPEPNLPRAAPTPGQ
jgi:tetratricopeptide (TPR) repeat protein